VVAVLGLDIGGANTKAAYVKAENGVLKEVRATSEYFPVWKNPGVLGELLSKLAEKTIGEDKIDAVGLTMTAELSDAYETKRQGVHDILNQAERAFQTLPVFILDVEGGLRTLKEAKMEPLKMAAANWEATGWLVSRILKNCIVLDIGSTSTSIIPVVDGVVSAAGETDLEKLINGELIYTGGLRTNVAAIVNSVPVGADVSRVSSELFATSGDVHLILENISDKDFTVETADGKGKTRTESLARLARVVCADVEILKEKEIVQIAQYVYDRQVEQVAEGLQEVYQRIRPKTTDEVTVVVTGFGKDFLARKAAEKVDFKRIVDFDDIVLGEASRFSTAVGVACMVTNKIGGEITQWKL
jgi:probable H4MPT-linked C1 transfer pathway protein